MTKRQNSGPKCLAAIGLLLGTAAAILYGLFFVTGVATAQQAVSPNYQVNEVFFGTGGELDACSTAYCSKQSAGETAVGNTASPGFQAQAGFNTDREEYLEFIVTNSATDLGVLTASAAATANGAFSVKSYLASAGYVVHTASDPPRSGTNFLASMAASAASTPGTEQFGINVVRNLTTCPTPAPANFGADPVQVPDSTFSFGTAAAGYNTCGLFKYVKGETIASSNKSSGQTNYTISYLYNISNATKAGLYTFNHDLVATSTF